MLAEAKQDELRQKMQALKDLYTSRHYTQCAKFGERLLGDVDSNAHPLHLAFLNFYTALSHDTLAREATLKNRYRELITAEKYYCAAIAILSPQLTPCSTPSLDEDQPSTPDSVTFPEESVWLRRLKATSYVSYRTSACSAMSEAMVPEQDMDLALSNLSFPQPPRMGMPVDLPDTGKLHPGYTGRNSMLVPLSTQFVRPKSTPPPAQLPPDTSSFVDMLQGHLASVRSLKENTGVRGTKFGIPSPSTSPTKPQLRIWRPSDLPDEQKEALQKRRREMTWRPRFDPRSIRKLCDEALDEI